MRSGLLDRSKEKAGAVLLRLFQSSINRNVQQYVKIVDRLKRLSKGLQHAISPSRVFLSMTIVMLFFGEPIALPPTSIEIRKSLDVESKER